MKLENKGISVKIIQDSVSSVSDDRITTFELEYPRFIHSELMTHRVFSRNAASSRAIPIDKMIVQVESDPAMPVEWGRNQKGMQASEVIEAEDMLSFCKATWINAAYDAAGSARALKDCGLHKQIVNRVLEPFQRMKTVVTATEFYNFFELRCHKDAQPEIKILAELMREACEQNKPIELNSFGWHLPYVNRRRMGAFRSEDNWEHYGYWEYYGYELDDNGDEQEVIYTLDTAQKVSASCCAQVSYRLLNTSVEKALKIYNLLVESKPIHGSPLEHAARPMAYDSKMIWEPGITHMDRDRNFWSGNFKGWIQYRQLL